MPEVGDAEIEKSIRIHFAGLENEDVGGIDKSAVIIGDFAEIAWNVVAKTRVVLLAVVAAEVPVVPLKMFALRVDLEHGSRARAEACPNLYVLQLHLAGRQRLIEDVRLGKNRAVIHPVAGFDEACRFCCRDPARHPPMR